MKAFTEAGRHRPHYYSAAESVGNFRYCVPKSETLQLFTHTLHAILVLGRLPPL